MNYRIQSITVEGLFGMFDHHIPLNQKERITIVYGVNGIGKTMIMRMVDALFEKQFWELGKLPFDKLILNFDEVNYLKISRNMKDEIFFISYEINNNKKTDVEVPLKRNYLYSDTNFAELITYITNTYPNWHKIDALNMYNSNKGEALSAQGFMDNYTHLLPADFQPDFRVPQELSDLLENVKAYFVPTQRMSVPNTITNKYTQYYGISSDSTVDAVTGCSQILINKINDVKNEYNDESNKLDSSLSKRLLEKKVNTNYSYEQLTQQAKIIQARQNELRSVGLVNGIVNDDFMLDESMNEVAKAIIAVNFQDIQLKLGVFNDIYEQLKLFINILNERHLSFKKIKISPKRGFIFINDNNVELTPDQLSSGEQHELVILYLLIFEIPRNALVMIDEPEISHHIMWQKSFVEDMLEIIKLRNFDVYVNTHSPSIINGNWDMTIPLREEELVEN